MTVSLQFYYDVKNTPDSTYSVCGQLVRYIIQNKDFKPVQPLWASIVYVTMNLLTMEDFTCTVEIQQKYYLCCLNSANGKLEIKSSRFTSSVLHEALFVFVTPAALSGNSRLLKSPDAVSRESVVCVFLIVYKSAGQCPGYVQSQCEMSTL